MMFMQHDTNFSAEGVPEGITDAFFSLDHQWRFTHVNDQAERLLSHGSGGLLGRSIWDEFPEAVGSTFEREFGRAVDERVAVSFEDFYPSLHAWLQVHAYPSSEGIFVYFLDITERIERGRRERFLADLAERARSLTDPNAVIADALRSVGEFLGLSRCVFADIDVEAATCTVPVDYCADDSVASLVGSFSISAFGETLINNYKAGRVSVIDDVQAISSQTLPKIIGAYASVGVRAHVSIPVVHSSRLVSVIGAHSAVPRHWELEEIELLRTVVERTWLTIEVTRQNRALAREAEITTRVLESITDAFFTLDHEWRFTYINRQAESLMTKTRKQIMGLSFWEAFPNLLGTQFEEEYRRAVAENVTITFQKFYAPLGAWLDVRAYPTEGGLSVFYQDITEKKLAEGRREQRERREHFLADLAERARSLTDPDKVIADALRSVGEFLGVSRCVFVDIDIEADTCTGHPDYRADDSVVSMAGTCSISAFGKSVVAAYAAGYAVAVDDVHDDPEQVPLESIAAYDALGILAHASVPVVHSSRLVSCIGAHSAVPRHWELEEIELLRTVVERTWLTIEVTRQNRALARAAEEQTARAEREALLNRIGQELLAGTDAAVTEGRVVSLLGKALGVQRCYIVSWDYAQNRAQIFQDYRHMDLPSLTGEYAASDYARAMSALFADGTAIVPDGCSPDLDPIVAAVMKDFGLRSLLAVPFFNREKKLVTAFWIAMTDEPQSWRPEVVSLVETVAAMTHTAVEAARVSERERNIAAQLQEALTPAIPARVPGMALSKHYRATLLEAQVGGDFYDVFAMEKSCTALVVGDVSGKGLMAATQVATVRHMLRYALYRSRTLSGALQSLNGLLAEQQLLTGFATLFVGVYDSGLGMMTYVNCGQEPALVRRSETGQIEMLEPTGPVLGSFEGATFESKTVMLERGDAVALFTDGLTEVGRSRTEMLGIEGVADLLERSAVPDELESAGAVAEHLSQSLIAGVDAAAHGGVMRDDVCLLIGVVE